jgi:GDP/UDP-N,N'-diacetylbacillosamine 2-epimerase (hydrolysing)
MTYPNSDLGSDYIIKELVKFSNENDKIHLFKNLGSRRYLSVMKYCGAVVGNSSSAIIEAPYLRIPAVNIGNRQKGRLKAESIIDCSNDCEDIVLAVNKALSGEFKEKAKYAKSLYGDGNTSKEIVRILKSLNIDEKLLKKKLV